MEYARLGRGRRWGIACDGKKRVNHREHREHRAERQRKTLGVLKAEARRQFHRRGAEDGERIGEREIGDRERMKGKQNEGGLGEHGWVQDWGMGVVEVGACGVLWSGVGGVV